MEIADLVTPAGVVPSLKATSKKQALQELSKKASDVCGLDEREIFDALIERERLGTTGLGIAVDAGADRPFLSLVQILECRLGQQEVERVVRLHRPRQIASDIASGSKHCFNRGKKDLMSSRHRDPDLPLIYE